MDNTIMALKKILKDLPSSWDGKEAILEMKNTGYNQWRQTEWFGFYFQYLCDRCLPHAGMKIPGSRFGNAQFDGNMFIDWDFKAHVMHNGDGKESNKLPANDLEATEKTIKQHGMTGLIVAMGEAVFDNPVSMPFRAWHNTLKGDESEYSKQNEVRGARKRLRKTSFKVKSINFYILTLNDLQTQGRFQEGMRNSNGNPRRSKLEIDLSKIKPVDIIEF